MYLGGVPRALRKSRMSGKPREPSRRRMWSAPGKAGTGHHAVPDRLRGLKVLMGVTADSSPMPAFAARIRKR